MAQKGTALGEMKQGGRSRAVGTKTGVSYPVRLPSERTGFTSARLKTNPRVLVDLSAALREQAGIPRVARQLVWSLAQAPEVDVAALVMSIHWQTRAGTLSRVLQPPRSLLADATFLSDALGQNSGDFDPLQMVGNFVRRYFFDRPYPLLPIQPRVFDDVLWEGYLGPSLPAHGRMLFDHCRFLRTPLTRREMTIRQRWMGRPARLNTTGFDFVIFQNPSLVRVSPGTTKIVRCHDGVPLFRFDTQPPDPRLITDYYKALDECARDSYFVCVSESTRDELLSIHPELAARSSVIPNSVPPAAAGMEAEPGDYFLAVGTIEPRKNYQRLLDGFRLYRRRVANPRPLTLVANPGWRSKEDLREIRLGVSEGWLTWLKGVSPERLTDLYAGAYGLVAASVHEGFGYPPLEAAAQGVPSVVSELKVFRSHLGEAAEYFDPYDPGSLAEALARLDERRRAELAPLAFQAAQRFRPDLELQQWQELFARLDADKKQAA